MDGSPACSKLARVVDVFVPRRLQVQERMTHQILDAIQESLNRSAVAVCYPKLSIYAHDDARPFRSRIVSRTTSAFSGVFENKCHPVFGVPQDSSLPGLR
jgi:GTP cyclohydrolase I